MEYVINRHTLMLFCHGYSQVGKFLEQRGVDFFIFFQQRGVDLFYFYKLFVVSPLDLQEPSWGWRWKQE